MIRRLLPSLFLTVAAFVLGACASADVQHKSGSTQRGYKVATIAIEATASTVDKNHGQYFEESGFRTAIETALRSELSRTGHLVATGPALTVKITDVRLRSTGAYVMLGMMAGPDYLDAQVELTENGKVLKSFSVTADCLTGTFGNPSSAGSLSRAEKMSQRLAEKLVEQL